MSNSSSRSNMTSVAAACILSAGLITAAIVDSNKPAPRVAATALAPPVSQESAGRQLREQLMNAAELRGIAANSGRCAIGDVRATKVVYSAKDDAFGIAFVTTWKFDSGATVSHSGDDVTLTNDGYGHYFATCHVTPPDPGETRSIDITLR